MRIIAAIAVACLAFAGAAHAENECLPLPQAKERAAELAAQGGGIWAELDHAETQTFMAAMNAVPPVTDMEADRIMVIRMPLFGVAIVARLEECGFRPLGKLSMHVFDRAWLAAKGSPA